MDARELTKKFYEMEDKMFKLEKENDFMKQQIQKLQLHLGDHLNMKLTD